MPCRPPGRRRLEAWPGFPTHSPSQPPSSFHPPFPPLYHGVGVNIPVGMSPGYKGLEPIVNGKTQRLCCPKTQTARGVSFKPPSPDGWGTFVVPGTPSALSRRPKHQVALGLSGHPGPCPRLSQPGRDPVLRTSELSSSACHTPRWRLGSRRSQSARALRVTSPGLGINCQVTCRGFHSFWLIRRTGMSVAESLSAPLAGARWGPAARLPGVQAAAVRR